MIHCIEAYMYMYIISRQYMVITMAALPQTNESFVTKHSRNTLKNILHQLHERLWISRKRIWMKRSEMLNMTTQT